MVKNILFLKKVKTKKQKDLRYLGKEAYGLPRAFRIETNNNTQESAAIESLEKDLVAAYVNCNIRDIVADDPMEKILRAITGESTSLKVVNLGESPYDFSDSRPTNSPWL